MGKDGGSDVEERSGMSIRQMIPMGTHLRKCPVCGAQINAKGEELTAHEVECLKVWPVATQEGSLKP